MAAHQHHIDENLIKEFEKPQQEKQDTPVVSENWASHKKKSSYNYHKLAQLIGKQPGLAVFRRFATLNAKNLLYLQVSHTKMRSLLYRSFVAYVVHGF